MLVSRVEIKTWEDNQKISSVILYFFNIRAEFLEGAPKSSTAFFTVLFLIESDDFFRANMNSFTSYTEHAGEE